MEKQKIQNLQNLLKKDSVLKSLERLRVISGKTRFKIIILLRSEKSGLNVSQISKTLKSSLSKISHQLTILKDEKIVVSTEKNRENIYKMNNHHLDKYLKFLFKI